MNVYFFAYRDWAFRIARDLHEVSRVIVPPDYLECATEYFTKSCGQDGEGSRSTPVTAVDPMNLSSIRKDFESFDILLFYGWSWMVPSSFTDDLTCICLHPSPLPLYRGGSPIQNQVIAGESKSAVTLFKMTQGLDDGPIFGQSQISLEGDLSHIFDQIYAAGLDLTKTLLRNWCAGVLEFKPQDELSATVCKRRKPEDGAILSTDSSKDIYNKVRCLQDPYPNAYLIAADGKKVYIKKIESER